MIWEHKLNTIVMLTKAVERSKVHVHSVSVLVHVCVLMHACVHACLSG